jgi:hypothetical protein
MVASEIITQEVERGVKGFEILIGIICGASCRFLGKAE